MTSSSDRASSDAAPSAAIAGRVAPGGAVARWLALVDGPGDGSAIRAALDDLLHPDTVFFSPVVHTGQQGRPLVRAYLTAALSVLHDGFRYTGYWQAERSAVLEFECRLGEVQVDGVDIIDWDADGRIVAFKVMIRPLKAIDAVRAAMAAKLAR